jgi:hypothetical protein
MRRAHLRWLLVGLSFALACGSSSGGNHGTPGADGGVSTNEGGDAKTGADSGPPAKNVTPLSVNQGPPGAEAADVPFVSVTICVPGTTTCQTIDDVIVDTGSSGLRILASALSSDLALPQQLATTGDALVECSQFDSGFTWGSVRLADVRMGGELASKIPIQLVGDPEFSSIPSACSCSGANIDSVEGLGGNGLMGINQIVPDCGNACTGPDALSGAYYSCSGSTCATTGVADAAQVSNPIASFATDNNGAVVEFPTVPAEGAATLAGQLIFGIGTEANNGLGSAKIITVDEYGNFTTNFNGQSLTESCIDSGTNLLSFNDGSIPLCPSELNFLFCPSSALSLVAENHGLNGVVSTVSFSVANAETLFTNVSYVAFDNLAGPGEDGSFDWGFPFFIGRNVFVALDGADTPGGKGPYFAY